MGRQRLFPKPTSHLRRPIRLRAFDVRPSVLQSFARSFSQAPMQICIVGDTSRIDRATLSRIAPVCDVDPESLFID